MESLSEKKVRLDALSLEVREAERAAERLRKKEARPAIVSSTHDVCGRVLRVGDMCAMSARTPKQGVHYGVVTRISESNVSVQCIVHGRKCSAICERAVKLYE